MSHSSFVERLRKRDLEVIYMIDPIDEYSSALRYGHFQRDLIAIITEQVVDAGLGQRYGLPDKQAVPKVVRQICFENALEFVKRNF